MLRTVLSASENVAGLFSVVVGVCCHFGWWCNMVHLDLHDLICLISGLQLIFCAGLFIRNRRKLKSLPLYNEIRSRISIIWHLLPISLCCGVCILCTLYARYMYSSVLLCLILLPFFWIHLVNEPMMLRRAVTQVDMRDESFRNVITLAVRSRILLMAMTVNLFLTWYVFICI